MQIDEGYNLCEGVRVHACTTSRRRDFHRKLANRLTGENLVAWAELLGMKK